MCIEFDIKELHIISGIFRLKGNFEFSLVITLFLVD